MKNYHWLSAAICLLCTACYQQKPIPITDLRLLNGTWTGTISRDCLWLGGSLKFSNNGSQFSIFDDAIKIYTNGVYERTIPRSKRATRVQWSLDNTKLAIWKQYLDQIHLEFVRVSDGSSLQTIVFDDLGLTQTNGLSVLSQDFSRLAIVDDDKTKIFEVATNTQINVINIKPTMLELSPNGNTLLALYLSAPDGVSYISTWSTNETEPKFTIQSNQTMQIAIMNNADFVVSKFNNQTLQNQLELRGLTNGELAKSIQIFGQITDLIPLFDGQRLAILNSTTNRSKNLKLQTTQPQSVSSPAIINFQTGDITSIQNVQFGSISNIDPSGENLATRYACGYELSKVNSSSKQTLNFANPEILPIAFDFVASYVSAYRYNLTGTATVDNKVLQIQGDAYPGGTVYLTPQTPVPAPANANIRLFDGTSNINRTSLWSFAGASSTYEGEFLPVQPTGQRPYRIAIKRP